MSDTQTAEVAQPPIEQRIATFTLHDVLLRFLTSLDAGHTEVTLDVNNELPEFTPKNFTPSNDLETYLVQNKRASSIKVTVDFGFKQADLIRGLSKSTLIIAKTWNCEMSAKVKASIGALQLELHSKALQRSLYVTFKPGK